MIRLIVFRHPFKSERTIREVPAKSIRELFADIKVGLPIGYARVMIDSEIIKDFDITPEDGSTVVIKMVPGDSGDVDQNEQNGGKAALGGIGLFIAGALISVLSAGILSEIGVGMMYAGGALFVGAIGYIGANALVGALFDDMNSTASTRDPTDVLPQIRGGRNKANPWGPIPIVLGTHLVVPPLAAIPFTHISGNDQYLNQLFCIGYNELVLSDYKIGDTPLDDYTGVTPPEVKTDGSLSAIVPKQVIETNVGQELKYNVPIVRTTAGKITTISFDITFPSGLVAYNDSGDKTNAAVQIKADYKPTGSPDTSYSSLVATFIVIKATSTTVREQHTANVSEGQYDVRITRTSADATDSKVIDKSYFGALRGTRNIDSVSPEMRAKICTLGLQIRASKQLNGAVDQFNCIAQSVLPVYSGSGSGPAQWTTKAATNNPASMFLYILQGQVNSRPVDDSMVDWPSLEAWYLWCETTSHECNAVITGVAPMMQILNKITSTGRAGFSKVDGRYTIIQDVERTTPIQHFTPRNSWGFTGSKAFPDMPHALKITFINKEVGYTSDERFVYDDGYDITNATKFQSVKSWGMTDPDQVWKDGRYQIACAKLRPEFFSLNCDIEYLVCTRGDLVRVTHDVPLLGIQAGRIKTVYVDGSSNATSVDIDETFVMETGKSYGVRIRESNGSSVYATVNTVDGNNTTLTFTTPIAAVDSPTAGDLIMFGEAGKESVEMIVIGVEANKDLSAKITMINYEPACYTADTGTIPPHDSKVTIPGDWDDSEIIHTIYNPDQDIIDSANAAAEGSGVTSGLPTFSDLDNGYTAPSGGTTTPNDPVFTIKAGLFKAIMLEWEAQNNLTNFLRYELQVSDDNTTWYSLQTDGTDWKKTLNDYTSLVTTFFIHGKIPLAGTSDTPLGQGLYYRVRRVTKALVASNYVGTGLVTTLPINSGDLAKESIYANNLKAGILQAQFIDVSQELTIGYVGTGTIDNPDEEDRRIYIDGDEISFIQYKSGSWDSSNIVKFGGVDTNGNFYPYARAKGIAHPLASEIDQTAALSGTFIVANFDGDWNDQNGTPIWDYIGYEELKTDQHKFGTGSMGAKVDGSTSVAIAEIYDTGLVLGTYDLTMSVWFRTTDLAAGNFQVTIFSANAGISLDSLTSGQLNVWLQKDYSASTYEDSWDTTFAHPLTINTWHMVTFTYQKETDTLVVTLDDQSQSFIPSTSQPAWNLTDTSTIQLTNQKSATETLNWYDRFIVSYNTVVDASILHNLYIANLPLDPSAYSLDLILKPATGGSVVIDGGLKLGNGSSNLLSYQKDNVSRTFSTTLADGWITNSFTVPAGSVIKTDFAIPMRNNSTSWGGGYAYVYYDTNESGNWLYLGNSGYDAVMMTGAEAILTYVNNFIQDFSATTEDFTIRYKFMHRSYDGTLSVNVSHEIVDGSGSDDGLSYAWSHIIVTKLNPTTGPKGDIGDTGAPGSAATNWNNQDPYPVDTVVGHNQQMWIAIRTNTNSEPVAGSLDWEVYSGRVFIDTVDPVAGDGNDSDIWYEY